MGRLGADVRACLDRAWQRGAGDTRRECEFRADVVAEPAAGPEPPAVDAVLALAGPGPAWRPRHLAGDRAERVVATRLPADRVADADHRGNPRRQRVRDLPRRRGRDARGSAWPPGG